MSRHRLRDSSIERVLEEVLNESDLEESEVDDDVEEIRTDSSSENEDEVEANPPDDNDTECDKFIAKSGRELCAWRWQQKLVREYLEAEGGTAPRSPYAAEEEVGVARRRLPPPPSPPPPRRLAAASSTMRQPLLATSRDHSLLQALVRSYQARGHLAARIDPLGVWFSGSSDSAVVGAERWRRLLPPDADLDTLYCLPETTFVGGGETDRLPLREIIARLEAAYCGPVGAEYQLTDSFEQRQWLRQQLEPPQNALLSAAVRRRALDKLIAAHAFEKFLSANWGSVRRFGIEGCEVLVPALCQLMEGAAALGVDTFQLGMAHRGRLNVMANVCRAPLHKLFALFVSLPFADSGSGDIKYHLGTHQQFESASTGRPIRVALLANPSHLEAVCAVVMGRTRALQRLSDRDPGKVMSILVHGDAALAGQGVAYECAQLSRLPAYGVGGTVHVVLNNQAGFTAEPAASRSSRYCTDVFRVTGAPVLHVNADSPDAVVRCCRIAAAFRHKFARDIVVDVVSYRRHGHSEHDDPSVTQPHRYKMIREKAPVTEYYQEKLISEGLLTAEEAEAIWSKYDTLFKQEMSRAQRETSHRLQDWSDLPAPRQPPAEACAPFAFPVTGLRADVLQAVAEAVLTPPAGMQLHTQVLQMLSSRLSKLRQGVIDWPTAEMLAVATLLRQGFPVRFTGQDVETGTFSQRHWVLHDQRAEGQRRTPLREVPGARAQLELSNSPVCEYAALGFEVGFASANPRQLVVWEAQFGDFCNLAQPVIDQFLAAGEAKWGRSCGLVLMCPHGLEGEGPEHSSARVERFLQLCADDAQRAKELAKPGAFLQQLRDTNLQVVCCSSPANLFHALRRQVAMPLRKPLVLLTHKALLRHPDMLSSLYDIAEDTQFQRLLPERDCSKEQAALISKLLFCMGRVYYDLCEERKFQGLADAIALARIEQLCPFPYDRVLAEVQRFPNATLYWVQQEHKNQGAWSYVRERLCSLLPDRELQFVGRPPASAPATGSSWKHHLEERTLLDQAMQLATEKAAE
ncbi:2-oxoglutarate dehydrogenase, mitochondrial-like [Schistocerca piceifrons]|uniref:2-oxoglutarate dehydrogenase, mitochondrial-like n=1 Tax=Schistocerca piceifrons TaxID=274613 RepID=UPI001F5E5D41|nr:2-oxoglutarate dehydrogenase, mitochondrial-like [Schistocerca piceifrons]